MVVHWTPEPECAVAGQSPADDDGAIIRAAISYMAQGLVVYNARSELIFHNATYRSIYNLRDEDLHPAMPIADVIALQAKSLGLDSEGIEEFSAPFVDNNDGSWSALRRLPDGRSIQMSRRSMKAGYFVVTHEDITDRVRMENEVRYTANHDTLTGLANRRSFLEQLDTALKRVRRDDRIALLAVDLDGFKKINDTHGHAIGDLVLKEVARRLRSNVRETDVVSRFGGDEFSIVQVPSTDGSTAEALAERIVQILTVPIIIGDLNLVIGASIGIALTDEQTNDSTTLMQHADLALYRAKHAGRGCFRFFDDRLNRSIRKRRETEIRMRQALENESFEIYYQPIVNIERGRVESVEALLRWKDNGKWISPGEFVPVAEECGLIAPLGDWVIREACRQAATWPSTLRVSVNVSPLQFNTGRLVDVVERALGAARLEPGRLKLEITESVLIDESKDVIKTLSELHGLGVQFALDDFGTGYSSLKYLTCFPFNKIKVDQSFVAGLPGSPRKLAVIRAATALGRDLGVDTIIEGVEDVDQLRAVHSVGCKYVQGFYFARPGPASELAGVIAAAEEKCQTQIKPQSHLSAVVDYLRRRTMRFKRLDDRSFVSTEHI